MPPADAAGDAADLFGAVSVAYGRHRPTYPEAFFEAFAAHLKPASGAAPLVWDCGCGSGQEGRHCVAV